MTLPSATSNNVAIVVRAFLRQLADILARWFSQPEPAPPGERKAWTFMVYIAGDNNLSQAGRNDLDEMKRAGSSDEVNIVAQYDRMSNRGTQRYYLRQHTTLEQDVVARLPETNSGAGETLEDFCRWAHDHYPAERYALVLWNHGTGWKDDDLYRGLQSRGIDAKLTRGQVRHLTTGRPSRALFRSSVETLAEEALVHSRAILFDDTSTDFLDNVEMKAVLERVTAYMGQEISLLGCDACLMSMVEVAYQLRGTCHCFVASQEEEPGDGWPYDTILARLVDNPNMSPELLAAIVVQEYNTFYRQLHPNLSVTQAALDLKRIAPLMVRIDALADALQDILHADYQEGNAAISLALYDAQRFADREYVDLVHFCVLLAKQNPDTAIGSAAQAIVALITHDPDHSPLLAEGHGGPGMRNVYGLSIYVAEQAVSPLYATLDFAQDNQWAEFLQARLLPKYRAHTR